MTQAAPLPVRRAPDPDVDRLARLGTWLAASETGATTPEALGMGAALRLYYTRELGLPPFAASELSIIRGRLVVSAKLLRALALRAGYRVVRDESTPDAVTASVVEAESGRVIGSSTFTMDDARRAGLVKERGGWQTYPARMLWARAAKYAIDDHLPDVALGMLTAEEAAEIDPDDPGPIALEAVEAYDPAVAVLDSTQQAAEEDAYREAAAVEARRLAHRDLALLIAQVEKDGTLPPSGHNDWTEYSRWVAKDRWDADSRSELDEAQIQALIEEVDHTATMLQGPPA